MKASLTLLGTGGAMGTPVIGCHCPVCRSPEPRNQRLRPSALLTVGNKKLLIDAGPDVRQQLLRSGVDAIDGLVLTHAHYDHTAGLDELRIFSWEQGNPVPCLLSNETLDELRKRFYYLFEQSRAFGSFATRFVFQTFPGDRGEIEFCGVPFRFLSFEQGGMQVNGFRFGELAYISDIREHADSVYEDLKGIRKLIVSAARFDETPFHFTVEEAVGFSTLVGAQETWLTHMGHEIDSTKSAEFLPAGVTLGYDGLEIPFDLRKHG